MSRQYVKSGESNLDKFVTNAKLAVIKADVPPLNGAVQINMNFSFTPDDGDQVEFVQHSLSRLGFPAGSERSGRRVVPARTPAQLIATWGAASAGRGGARAVSPAFFGGACTLVIKPSLLKRSRPWKPNGACLLLIKMKKSFH